MTKLFAAFAALSLAAVAACTDPTPPRELMETGAPVAGAPTLPLTSLGELDPSESVCDCATLACVDKWIDETFGCGVCVDLVCGDRRLGGCVACPDAERALP